MSMLIKPEKLTEIIERIDDLGPSVGPIVKPPKVKKDSGANDLLRNYLKLPFDSDHAFGPHSHSIVPGGLLV